MLLLLLDWLSVKFPGQEQRDVEDEAATVTDSPRPEATSEKEKGKEASGMPTICVVTADEALAKARASAKRNQQRRRFLDPVMLLLAPPCEWCLRNMSVMFTPSFILIPARETLPAREIGLLTGWFAATQILGFVFPVLACFAFNWICRKAPKWMSSLAVKRRGTMSSLKPLSSSATPSRKGSSATLAGMDFEKRLSYSGGQKLGSIATGLSGLTAVVVAPISHVNMDSIAEDLDDDAMSHFEGVAMENARQQGDPFMRRAQSKAGGGPRSNVSNFEHPSISRLHSSRGEPRSRSRSRSRDRRRPGSAGRPEIGGRPGSNDRPPSRDRPASSGGRSDKAESNTNVGSPRFNSPRSPQSPSSPEFDALLGWNFPGRENPMQRSYTTGLSADSFVSPLVPEPGPAHAGPVRSFTALGGVTAGANCHRSTSLGAEPQLDRSRKDGKPSGLRAAATALVPSRLRLGFTSEQISPVASSTGSQTHCLSVPTESKSILRTSRSNSAATLREDSDEIRKGDGTGLSPDNDEAQAMGTLHKVPHQQPHLPDEAPEESPEDDSSAIERLADWISDLITPVIYFVAFIIGLPLYFILDFALLLFLSINLLTFIAAITIVPPRVRRFLHPILSTSVATVLLIWALGAIKGLSIKEALAQYSIGDARYTDLWNPAGYQGPVPGAGDVLFSTLDAGIVALAIPMYRYRKDLRDNFFRMMGVLVPCALLSLFVWPTIGRFVGLDAVRNLAFSARFMSTPLAIEMANTVGADESM